MTDESEIAPAPTIPETRITPNVSGSLPEAEVERFLGTGKKQEA